MINKIIINCDGGARGNPGPAASAFIARKNGKIIIERSKFLGNATNNIAEYSGVIDALTWLKNYNYHVEDLFIEIFLDSELVTKQLLGIYKTKNPKLKELLLAAKLLERKINIQINYKLIRREKNFEADLLVNKVLNNL